MGKAEGGLVLEADAAFGGDDHVVTPIGMAGQGLAKDALAGRVGVVEKGIASFDGCFDRFDAIFNGGGVNLVPIPRAGDPHAAVREAGDFDFALAEWDGLHAPFLPRRRGMAMRDVVRAIASTLTTRCSAG